MSEGGESGDVLYIQLEKKWYAERSGQRGHVANTAVRVKSRHGPFPSNSTPAFALLAFPLVLRQSKH